MTTVFPSLVKVGDSRLPSELEIAKTGPPPTPPVFATVSFQSFVPVSSGGGLGGRSALRTVVAYVPSRSCGTAAEAAGAEAGVVPLDDVSEESSDPQPPATAATATASSVDL